MWSLASRQCRQAAYEAVFDPLDGSRNIDAGIPTGTIFGIYRATGETGLLVTFSRAPCAGQGIVQEIVQ